MLKKVLIFLVFSACFSECSNKERIVNSNSTDVIMEEDYEISASPTILQETVQSLQDLNKEQEKLRIIESREIYEQKSTISEEIDLDKTLEDLDKINSLMENI